MELRVYNTFSGNKETFEPFEKNKVNMYVCGPTVYDASHIGHARSVVVFDVIFRWLEDLGYDVCYVRNFTDVDDKIINKANETGQSCSQITQRYIKEFHDEMDALNVRRPTMEPKATEHIDGIIHFIGMLIEKGKAYAVEGGDVYFSIDSFEDYGRLSGRNPDDMIAGARIAVDEKKKNPLDFTLWKPAKPNEPFWESPWGKGRPGWHIECSAMSYKYLGRGFDIHGGGKDLVFPHHENEIAQSEALFGEKFVKYWIHNGFVDINNEKMSKSLGNFTMIKDVLKQYSPEVIRLFLLSKHYRSPIDYSEESMREVSQGLDRIYAFLERLETVGANRPVSQTGPLWEKFYKAMNDDFNSAKGMACIFEAVKNGNKVLDSAPKKIDETILQALSLDHNDIKAAGNILGVFLMTPKAYFDAKKTKALSGSAISSTKIEAMIELRNQARKEKDFQKADEIRDQLLKEKIVLKDGPQGTTWDII